MRIGSPQRSFVAWRDLPVEPRERRQASTTIPCARHMSRSFTAPEIRPDELRRRHADDAWT